MAGDMEPLSNQEMSDVNGQGVGIVMEDFRFSQRHDSGTFKLGGITNDAGENVEVIVNNLYLGGEDSDFGNDLQTFNLGRLTNPFRLQLLDGDELSNASESAFRGKAVLEFSAPKKVAQGAGVACLPGGSDTGCVSRAPSSGVRGERMDMGVATTIRSGSSAPQNLNVHFESAVVDGSHIRLFGAEASDGDQRLRAQIQSNLYTPRLSINACDQTGASCGDSIAFNDFMMELTLGTEVQPLLLSVLGAGHEVQAERGNLRVELDDIEGRSTEFYEDYYANPDNRSDIRVGDIQIGDQNLGGMRMEGMLFQKLETTTRSLD